MDKLKKHKGKIVTILILGIVYGILFYSMGYPLGFGKIIAKHHITNYCDAVFPYEDVAFEFRGYNPKSSGFEAIVLTESGEQYLYYNPKRNSIGDKNRADEFRLKHGLTEWVNEIEMPSHFVSLSIYTTTDDPYTLKHNLHIQIRKAVEEMPMIDETKEQADLAGIAMTYYESLCKEKQEVAKNLARISIIRTPYFTDNTKEDPPRTSLAVKIGNGVDIQLDDLLNADLIVK